MREIYPLVVERRLSRRLWGGERLANYLGLEEAPGSEPLAEAWQVYAGNTVRNGAHAGKTLREVAGEQGATLLGTATLSRYGKTVPLLAKFIDAGQPLSIQVHPGDDYALRCEAGSGHLGKAEAWYILSCRPGSEIVWGFREEVTAERVRQAVEDGDLHRLLNRVPVAPGDVIYNPEGTVHAVGAGVFLFEIQQSSDLTYRLYDYGRRREDGRERELHLDKALEVASLAAGEFAKVAPLDLGGGRRLLIESRHFAMEAIEPGRGLALETSPASIEYLTVTRGEVRLEAGAGTTEFETGGSVVLPAALGEFGLAGDGEILRCYLPVS